MAFPVGESLTLLPGAGLAKVYEPPKSSSLQDRLPTSVERKTLAAIDPQEHLLAADRDRGKDAQRPGPLRFAVTEDVGFSLDNSGTWQEVPGGRLWRLRIQTPGAVSHNLGITRFDIPEGAKSYDPAQKQLGPYTSRNRSHLGDFSTRSWRRRDRGRAVRPRGASRAVVGIGKANKGYRGFGEGRPARLERRVVRHRRRLSRGQSVAEPDPLDRRLHDQRQLACTGNLLNNTAVDFRPFVLSANHCGVNDTADATIVAFWNFQSATCGTHGPGPTTDTQSGATFRAASAPSDFVLFELDATPDPSFNVFYAGWDASSVAPPGNVCVHHPSADVKAISFSNTPPLSTAYFSSMPGFQPPTTGAWSGTSLAPDPPNQVAITEGGSSGSCLFASDTGRCVGHYSGRRSVAPPPHPWNDYYGKLSVELDRRQHAASRLRDWLDPGNTGVLGLDGDPHITTLDGTHYDFQGAGEFVALRDAGGAEIQVRQAPIATTFNPGADPYDGLATCRPGTPRSRRASASTR